MVLSLLILRIGGLKKGVKNGSKSLQEGQQGSSRGSKNDESLFWTFFHGFVIFQCSSGDVLRSRDFRGSKNGPKMDHFVGGSLTIVLLPCSVNLDFRGPKNRKVDFWAKKFNMVSRSSTLTRPCTRARVLGPRIKDFLVIFFVEFEGSKITLFRLSLIGD